MRKPKLLLKPSAFKTNKLYSILPENGNGDFSVSGYVGNGTRVNKNGLIESVATDTPRLDYFNGIGLLVEPTRTNEIPYSQEIDNAAWAKSNVTVTADDTISPDGGKNACKVVDATAGANGYISETITVSDATAIHTFSFYVKHKKKYTPQSISAITVGLIASASGNQTSYTIYENGTITKDIDTGSTGVTQSVTRFNEDWLRVEIVDDMADTDTSIEFRIRTGYLAQDQNTMWIWGVQFEEGSFATSYIPTSGSALTRTADTLQVASATSNGLLPDTNLTVFVDLDLKNVQADASNGVLTIGTTNGRIYVNGDSVDAGYGQVFVNSTDASSDSFTLLTGRNKVAFSLAYDSGDVWINGTKQIETATQFNFTLDTISINGAGVYGKIRELAIYDVLFSESELKSMTQ